ncbi:MAG: aspartate 1-decarboxylase [Alphaproteobacteria bacterium]
MNSACISPLFTPVQQKIMASPHGFPMLPPTSGPKKFLAREYCTALIHHAIITQADPHYVGSITLPASLGFLPGEMVRIRSAATGQHVSTYVIEGKTDDICLNGGAAQFFNVGDVVDIRRIIYSDTRQQESFFHHLQHNSQKVALPLASDGQMVFYAGKLHQIRSQKPIELQRATYQGALLFPQHLNSEEKTPPKIILISANLAQKAGLVHGGLVDFLPLNIPLRESMTLYYCDHEDDNHMSVYGVDVPIATTAVIIGYHLLPVAEAKDFADKIRQQGYPNLVLCDSDNRMINQQRGTVYWQHQFIGSTLCPPATMLNT